MKASVFVGTSLDGFIARANGSFDFLPPGGGEPHGYDEFMATVDATASRSLASPRAIFLSRMSPPASMQAASSRVSTK